VSERDLLQCQKRPTTVSKETYKCDVVRGLRAETGETLVSKETYSLSPET